MSIILELTKKTYKNQNPTWAIIGFYFRKQRKRAEKISLKVDFLALQ